MQRVGYIVARTAVVAFGIALLAGVPPAMLFAETAAECTGAPGRDFRPINIGLFSNGVPASSEMPTGSHEIATPFGFISFCMRNPDQCADPSGQPQIVHLDEGTWKTLLSVNEHVNNTMKFEDDMAHFGKKEYWTISKDGFGDCEDNALTKRKELIDDGFPAAALRIAVVHTWEKLPHAVLTVATDRGDYVLDSRNWRVLPWNKTDYVWISRKDAGTPMGWISLNGG